VLAKHPGARVIITSAFYHSIYSRLCAAGVREADVSDPFFSNGNKMHGLSVEGVEDFRHKMEPVAQLFRREQDRQFAANLWRLYAYSGDVTSDAAFFVESHVRLREQYFDFITPELVRVVVDGGVMDGHTLQRFAHHMPQARVYGFEPYAPVFLLSPLRTHVERNPNIEVIFKGLSDVCGHAGVHVEPTCIGGTTLVGKQGDVGEDDVEVVTLDDFVAERGLGSLDYVKLDIEGAEMSCLRGAGRAIERFRPQLAVCLYHSPDDYHRIPAHLASTLVGYNFYLGMYDPVLFSETVLYAIPAEKDRNP